MINIVEKPNNGDNQLALEIKEKLKEELKGKTMEELRKNSLFIIGGDGTFIYAVGKYKINKVPKIYAFNTGAVGALLPLDPKKHREIISSIKNNKMKFIRRNRLSVGSAIHRAAETANQIERSLIFSDRYVINDVIVFPERPRLVNFTVKIDGECLSINADSVVISTRSGSTGHSASLGGPVLLGDFLVVSVVGANACNFRSLVVSLGSELRVLCEGCRCQIDGKYEVLCSSEYVVSNADWYEVAVDEDYLEIGRAVDYFYIPKLKPPH